jgi:hypothetical protein
MTNLNWLRSRPFRLRHVCPHFRHRLTLASFGAVTRRLQQQTAAVPGDGKAEWTRAVSIAGNGRVARQSLVKRRALGSRAQKGLGKKGIRPHLVMQLRVTLGRLNNSEASSQIDKAFRIGVPVRKALSIG